jgi:hypothetical protein
VDLITSEAQRAKKAAAKINCSGLFVSSLFRSMRHTDEKSSVTVSSVDGPNLSFRLADSNPTGHLG